MLANWKRYVAWENVGIHKTPWYILMSAIVDVSALVLLIAKFWTVLLVTAWFWYFAIGAAAAVVLLYFIVTSHALDWYMFNTAKLMFVALTLLLATLWPPLASAAWYWYALVFILLAARPIADAIGSLRPNV